MNTQDLLQYADILLAAAIAKTHDYDTAQELVQETYLHALAAIVKGKTIENPKAYLLSILHNRFYLLLRKKYRMCTVSYDVMSVDVIDDTDNYAEIIRTQDAALLRRELAFLSRIYREIIVRYYMQEQPVEQIAKVLNIPKGTVLSRLDTGRKKIKQGVEDMESYVHNSFQPERLVLGMNGRTGLNNEPFSCVKSVLDQNLLILAYNEPVTTEELAKALGTPMVFIEESVANLVYNQLLKQEGKKVYTDFVIISHVDDLKNVEISKSYARETFETANPIFLEMVKRYKEIEGLRSCSETWLYILAVLSCRNNYMCRIDENICGKTIEFVDYPDRPNFGKWIATGSRFPDGYKYDDERSRHSVSGRSATDDISPGIKSSCEWNTAIGATHSAVFKYSLTQKERTLAIDAVNNGNPNPFQAELIPDLEKYGFIKTENNKKVSAIPYITADEVKRFFEIESHYADRYCKLLLKKAVDTAGNAQLKYPDRISLIPDYIYSEPVFYHPMAYIYEAAGKGVITLEEGRNYPIMYIVKR